MSTALERINALAYPKDGGGVFVKPEARDDVRNAVIAFLDMASTATGQETFYNSKQAQLEAMNSIHDAVFAVNRGLYAAMLTLPGVNDNAIQRGVDKLLGVKPLDDSSFLTSDQEDIAISVLTRAPYSQRALKMFKMFRDSKTNNAKARNLILNYIFGYKDLPFLCVKYRSKIKMALTHAWGQKKTMAIKIILNKDGDRTQKEKALIRRSITKYVSGDTDVEDCVLFALSADGSKLRDQRPYRTERFSVYEDAKGDVSLGSRLPHEVLEGHRGRFFDSKKDKDLPGGRGKPENEDVTAAKVLELTANTLTTRQRTTKQRSAREAGVEVKMDYKNEDLTKLYVLALEDGMNQEMRDAIDEKAAHVAEHMAVKYERVSIVVDTSKSMLGTKTGKYRPLAVALAMRDVLAESATEACIIPTAGSFDRWGLVQPEGDTSLARALVDALKAEPDAVYVITDGYENAPAGRFAEVVAAARKLGVEIPILQVAPVMGSESAGIRKISEQISALPVTKPEGLGLSVIRAALDTDVEAGIGGLLEISVPKLLR